jgi:hypothetical protein
MDKISLINKSLKNIFHTSWKKVLLTVADAGHLGINN